MIAEWRDDMENAPRNGTRVLVGHRNYVREAEWVQRLNGEDDEGWTAHDVQSWNYEEEAYLEPQPTHWMPLPEPPK